MSESLILEWLDENRLRSFPLKPKSDFSIIGYPSLKLNEIILDAFFVYQSTKPTAIKLESININGPQVTFYITGLSPFVVSNALAAIYPYYIRNTEGSLLVVDSGVRALAANSSMITTTTTTAATAAPTTTSTTTAAPVVVTTTTTTAAPILAPYAPVLISLDENNIGYNGNLSASVTFSWNGPAQYTGIGKLEFFASTALNPIWPTNYDLTPTVAAPVTGQFTTWVKQFNVPENTNIYIVARYNGLVIGPISNALAVLTPYLVTTTTLAPVSVGPMASSIQASGTFTFNGLLKGLAAIRMTRSCTSGVQASLKGASTLTSNMIGSVTVYARLMDGRSKLDVVIASSSAFAPSILKAKGKLTATIAVPAPTFTATIKATGKLSSNVLSYGRCDSVLRNGSPKIIANIAAGTVVSATLRTGNTTIGIASTIVASSLVSFTLTGIEVNPFGCAKTLWVGTDSYTQEYWDHNGSYNMPEGFYTVTYQNGAMQNKADGRWSVNPGYTTWIEYSNSSYGQGFNADTATYATQAQAEAAFRQVLIAQNGIAGYEFYHTTGFIKIVLNVESAIYAPGNPTPTWKLTPCPADTITTCPDGYHPVQDAAGVWSCYTPVTTPAPEIP